MTRLLPCLLTAFASLAVGLAPASAIAADDDPTTAAAAEAEAVRPLAGVVELAVELGILVLVIGIVLCLYRILRGPQLVDRVLANDALALHVVGLVVALAIYQRTPDFLDVALVVAILGFAGTLAFAQYIAARGAAEEPDAGEPETRSQGSQP